MANHQKEMGLWIDHKKAVIVTIIGKGDEVKQIESDMEKHMRFSGGAADFTEEDMRDRRFANHLSKYYDEVITAIRDADAILILGPGEAKGELKKSLESEQLGGHIVGVETCDKLTDGQIAAKVRDYFAKK